MLYLILYYCIKSTELGDVPVIILLHIYDNCYFHSYNMCTIVFANLTVYRAITSQTMVY